MMQRRIVILGAPGAGKGTQAVYIAEGLSIPHISTGEMMRAAVAVGGDLGSKVKGFLDAGELVPDPVIIEVVGERLGREDASGGFLLDGFPRTLPQAEALTNLLDQLGRPLSDVIELVVPEEVLKQRILGRAQEGGGRTDDSVEVISKRLEVYRSQTAPVSQYYAKQDKLRSIDGLGSVEEVRTRVFQALEV